MSARPIAARKPAMPPPTTSALGRRLDDDRLERLREARAVDAGAHEAHRLLGRALVVVGVRPGALLADVDLGVLEGVQAGALGDVAEGDGVELGRARGDDQPVEALLVDVLHDLLLGRVRAGEHRRAGDDDVVVVSTASTTWSTST